MLNTLNAWLNWQEQLHPKAIDLGLERVAHVWSKLRPKGLNCPVITVGGTNGKGSCVALLGSILQAAGFKVGLYTSPHLIRYNERIVINGISCDDDVLCAAFARIEQTRDKVSLTYFEFGTLAALEIFTAANLDVVILEVGLGGRLDAVNIIDADAALVTTIDIDHTEWLGSDRDSIAKEKAGIFRASRPAIIGDFNPPAALIDAAVAANAQILRAGQDFCFTRDTHEWSWYCHQRGIDQLPFPALQGTRQIHNAAAVLMVLDSLTNILPVPETAIYEGLRSVHLPARFQIISDNVITWILDVAHNPQAAYYLAENLANLPYTERTHIIFACLADKDAANIIRNLAPQINIWHFASVLGSRARNWEELATIAKINGINVPIYGHNSVNAAVTAVLHTAQAGERVVVTGSFITVAEALATGLLPIKSQVTM